MGKTCPAFIPTRVFLTTKIYQKAWPLDTKNKRDFIIVKAYKRLVLILGVIKRLIFAANEVLENYPMLLKYIKSADCA